MNFRLCRTCRVVACLLLLASATPQAIADTLLPEWDLWLRESDPDGVYENDALWVATADAVGENRWSLAEWDISGLPEITSAFMEFNPRTRADADSVQIAEVTDPGVAGLTWNSYQASRVGLEIPFESFGGITVPPSGLPFQTYARGNDASAADLALLNNLRTTTGTLPVVFKPTLGAMEWNDGANAGGGGFASDFPIRLVVNEVPPAGTILPATADVWVRESDPTGVYENDALHVSDPATTGDNAPRITLVEFDLSGVGEIAAAHIQVAKRSGAAEGSAMQAFQIPDGILGINWDGYVNDKVPQQVSLQTLGSLTVPPAGLPTDAYTATAAATPMDIALLNNLCATTGTLTVAMVSNGGFFEFHDGANAGGGGFSLDLPMRLVIEEGTAPPTDPTGLWRADFDDASGSSNPTGNEPLAVAASSRFDDSNGLWSTVTVPHHDGSGFGGITGFSRTIFDSNGVAPITWTHVGGDAVRANNPGDPDAAVGDFWFFTKTESVDWEISGLVPGAEYEMFHYGGWPVETPDDERISIMLDTNGDGAVDETQVAGIATGGPDGVHFQSIVAGADGKIVGRWEGVPDTPSWADTSGFQLALVQIPEPSSFALVLMALVVAAAGRWRR